MKLKNLLTISVLLVTLITASVSWSQVTVEYLGVGSALSISGDGSVIVGNSYPDYETFRWTRETGMQLLGRGTVAIFGSGAGGPDVSDDGRYVTGTIASLDSTYITVGRWNVDTGWEEMLPPLPPGGGMVDNAYGSAWGLSDDGSTVTGLFWLTEGGPFGAHGLAWTREGGPVDMGTTYGNSRINDANYDGSVLVGWDQRQDGVWQPAVWDNGTLTWLSETEAFCLANCVTPDGNLIGGSATNENGVRVATAWIRQGETWQENILGALPGTGSPFGNAVVTDVSDDGSLLVGFNAWDPGWSTGFIFTLEDGLVDVDNFLADNGVEFDPTLNIVSLTGVSGDGKHITGIATQVFPPYANYSFVIHLDTSSSVPVPVMTHSLEPSYPNPFNPQTTVPINLRQGDSVQLEVYDAAGRRVKTLHQGYLSAGRHEFVWSGRNGQDRPVSSGVYFSRLTDGQGNIATRRMVLVK